MGRDVVESQENRCYLQDAHQSLHPPPLIPLSILTGYLRGERVQWSLMAPWTRPFCPDTSWGCWMTAHSLTLGPYIMNHVHLPPTLSLGTS